MALLLIFLVFHPISILSLPSSPSSSSALPSSSQSAQLTQQQFIACNCTYPSRCCYLLDVPFCCGHVFPLAIEKFLFQFPPHYLLMSHSLPLLLGGGGCSLGWHKNAAESSAARWEAAAAVPMCGTRRPAVRPESSATAKAHASPYLKSPRNCVRMASSHSRFFALCSDCALTHQASK